MKRKLKIYESNRHINYDVLLLIKDYSNRIRDKK